MQVDKWISRYALTGYIGVKFKNYDSISATFHLRDWGFPFAVSFCRDYFTFQFLCFSITWQRSTF